MHQTFYIDVDEEISSIIDRLNKSMSVDNYFVLPKRALFLQSIVNMKILKRESEKLRKHVIIVTQDEIGISMADRAGIDVRDNLDGVETASGIYMEQNLNEEEEIVSTQHHVKKRQIAVDDKKARLSGVGTNEFFVSAEESKGRKIKVAPVKKTEIKGGHKLSKNPNEVTIKKTIHQSVINHKSARLNQHTSSKLDPYKEQSLEKMFGQRDWENQKPKEVLSHRSSGKIKKFIFGFVVLCLIIFGGVAAFLLIPSANIIISPNVATKKIDLDILGTNSSSLEQSIPVRVIAKEEQISFPYDLSNQTVVSGQKAKGSVTIYNEYSDSPQTLIATTRLKTEDGKIFHIVKNVVVPGYTKVGEQIKAGSVRADVIADQAGDDYNMEEAKFNIPGFEGGPKFDKFYATNEGAIKGGVADGTQKGVGVVSQNDIDSAKVKAEAAFKEKVNSDIAEQLGKNEIALPQAENIAITKSSSSAKNGAKVSSYSYDVQGTYKVVTFSEDDIKKMILAKLKGDNDLQKATIKISKIDYGTIDTDFDAETFKLKVHADVSIEPKIDLDQIKSDLLGKSDDELEDILRKYATINKADVEFQPSFITRVPQYGQRVTIQIKEDK